MERSIPRFIGVHAEPTPMHNLMLAALPFILLAAVYLMASHTKLQVNPDYKLLPSPAKMVRTTSAYIYSAKADSDGKMEVVSLLLIDTSKSLMRIGIGLSLSALTGLLLGVNMGLFPGFRSLSSAFVKFLSIIPPLAILPILMLAFGVDEVGKIVLIYLGTMFLIARDIALSVEKIHAELKTKAYTLGASGTELTYRIVLPMMMPKLIDSIRLCLGPAWLFLIAAEAIASMNGLGYRIFLVRRYLSMDLIIPIVFWITFLGYTMEEMLRRYSEKKYRWYHSNAHK